MRKIVGLVGVLGAALLFAGCAQPSEFDEAWDACVRLYDDVYPDGFTNAETDELVDSEAACDGALETQGRDQFVELFLDPAFLERYEKGLRG